MDCGVETPAILAVCEVNGACNPICSVGLDSGYKRLQEIAGDFVVPIDEGYVFSLRMIQTDVSCCRQASVFLPKEFETRVACRCFLRYCSAPICRAVIYDDGLKVMPSLLSYRFDTCLNVILNVIDRDNHRN
jgi:hypothetical protein